MPWLYPLPTRPLPRSDVNINAEGATVTGSARSTVNPAASVALTVKANGPATVGDLDRVRWSRLASARSQRAALIENAYGAVPPAALIVRLYALPTVPFGSVAGATASVAATVNTTARCPVAPPPSVAVIVKFEVAAVVGIPEITPVAGFNVSPAGRLPADTLKT